MGEGLVHLKIEMKGKAEKIFDLTKLTVNKREDGVS